MQGDFLVHLADQTNPKTKCWCQVKESEQIQTNQQEFHFDHHSGQLAHTHWCAQRKGACGEIQNSFLMNTFLYISVGFS